MKKDRACGMPYPVYGPMPGYMPNMGVPVMPNMNGGIMQTPTTSQNTDINTLNSKVNSLEKRVAALESLMGNSSNYNPSNYQMM